MRRSLLVLAVLATGCPRASQPTTEVRSDPPIAKPSTSVAPPDASAALCPALSAASKTAYRNAARKWFGDAGTPTGHSFIGWCADSATGAWSIEMPDLATVHDVHEFEYAVEARFAIAFHPQSGAAVRYVPKDVFSDYGIRVVKDPWTYDFDGDGVPEIFIDAHEEGEEGHHVARLELLSFRSAAIVRYAPAAAIAVAGAKDVDGDGRPDLLIRAGYTESLEGCGSGFSYDTPDPWFIAHARPDGTFSFDDAAAKDFVRKSCPAKPASIASSFDAVCARLWAKDLPKERARVVASCTAWSCAADIAGTPQKKTAAQDCERRPRFFDRTPPFTLP